MSKVATQNDLNSLLESTVDLGRGRGYCPTYSKIMENWKYVPSSIEYITANISESSCHYDGYADDIFVSYTVTLSKPAPRKLRIIVQHSDTYDGEYTELWDDVYIEEGKTSGSGHSAGYGPGYLKLGYIWDYDTDEISKDVVWDKNIKYTGSMEKYDNLASVNIDDSGYQVGITVTFEYNVKSNLRCRVDWTEMRGPDVSGTNWTYVDIKSGDNEGYTSVSNQSGDTATFDDITITPSSDEYFNYSY